MNSKTSVLGILTYIIIALFAAGFSYGSTKVLSFPMTGLSLSLSIIQFTFIVLTVNSNLPLRIIAGIIAAVVPPLVSQAISQYLFDKGNGVTFPGYYSLAFIALFIQTILIWLLAGQLTSYGRRKNKTGKQ